MLRAAPAAVYANAHAARADAGGDPPSALIKLAFFAAVVLCKLQEREIADCCLGNCR